MGREPIRIWCFAVVAVRSAGRFVIVQERKHRQTWYLPAGRVEPGEDFVSGARRETLEEAGIAVSIDAIVRVEYSPRGNDARLRVVFLASPEGDETLPPEGGEDALAARWVTPDDLGELSIRDPSIIGLMQYLNEGGAVYPLDLLTWESAPYGL